MPRPDSEVLVAAALEILADREPEKFIVDLGTGTGCLLLSILHHHSKATGVGIDISEKALDMAKANAESLNLGTRARFEIGNFVQKDRFTTIMAKADLIVCNPPYIATDEIPLLDPEVCQYDPYQAIDGGIDGLACYRALFPEVKACLKPEGRAIFEIGYRQSGAVAGLAERYNLRVYRMAYDLSGHKRAVILGQP
ncbi:MAG: HemK/PrmC family methyltransferase [Alphaproteobacteria bacterium]